MDSVVARFIEPLSPINGATTMKQKQQKGFTLIELLVVIAIIGALAGIVLLALNNARMKARDAKRVGDIRQLVTSFEQYYTQNGVYPTGTASVGASGGLISDPNSSNGGAELLSPTYVGILPDAPVPADGNCSQSAGRGNNNYWYDATIDGTYYTLTFCLGHAVDYWPEGTRTAGPQGIQ